MAKLHAVNVIIVLDFMYIHVMAHSKQSSATAATVKGKKVITACKAFEESLKKQEKQKIFLYLTLWFTMRRSELWCKKYCSTDVLSVEF